MTKQPSLTFDEQKYLAHNPDVARAVAEGRFASGWQHFMQGGFRESRSGTPDKVDRSDLDRFEEEELQRYWNERKSSVYLQHLRALVNFIGRDARSIIDVGSNGCPYLEWFGWIPNRVSLDLNKPYRGKNVVAVKQDLLNYRTNFVFDLCICLQVLEHVPNAADFARRLLSLSPHVLISVPYRWPITNHTKAMGHIHDPVDEQKLTSWFGREPDFQMISEEIATPVRRLICYYRGK
jgi:hypothetical protein